MLGRKGFLKATVYGRIFLFLCFCLLVGIRNVEPQLLIIGVINLIGALLMSDALRKDEETRAITTTGPSFGRAK